MGGAPEVIAEFAISTEDIDFYSPTHNVAHVISWSKYSPDYKAAKDPARLFALGKKWLFRRENGSDLIDADVNSSAAGFVSKKLEEELDKHFQRTPSLSVAEGEKGLSIFFPSTELMLFFRLAYARKKDMQKIWKMAEKLNIPMSSKQQFAGSLYMFFEERKALHGEPWFAYPGEAARAAWEHQENRGTLIGFSGRTRNTPNSLKLRA